MLTAGGSIGNIAAQLYCMLKPIKKLASPFGCLNHPIHSHYHSLSPTLSRISQLSTHHSSISTSPGVITHSTPHIVHANLHSAFVWNVTSCQSQTSFTWSYKWEVWDYSLLQTPHIALPFYNITYSHRYIAQVITSVLNKHPFLVTACGCAVRQSTYAV